MSIQPNTKGDKTGKVAVVSKTFHNVRMYFMYSPHKISRPEYEEKYFWVGSIRHLEGIVPSGYMTLLDFYNINDINEIETYLYQRNIKKMPTGEW